MYILKIHIAFKKLDIHKGEKIALCGSNSVNWALIYLSVVSYGAVVVPILVDFSKEDIEGMFKILDKDYKSYKAYSNIRLSLASEEMINKSMKTLKERYPKLTLKFIKKKTEESNKINLLDINVHVDSFQITKENIKELMDEEMSNYELNEQEKLTYDNEFKKILEEVG